MDQSSSQSNFLSVLDLPIIEAIDLPVDSFIVIIEQQKELCMLYEQTFLDLDIPSSDGTSYRALKSELLHRGYNVELKRMSFAGLAKVYELRITW